MRLRTHTTRRRARDSATRRSRVQAERAGRPGGGRRPRAAPSPVVRCDDRRRRTGPAASSSTVGHELTTTHGTPARRARSAATLTASQVGACSWRQALVVAVEDDRPRPGRGTGPRPRRGRRPPPPRRPGLGPLVGHHGHRRRRPGAAARPAPPPRLIDGTTTRVGPQLGQLGDDRSGVGGRRQAQGERAIDGKAGQQPGRRGGAGRPKAAPARRSRP